MLIKNREPWGWGWCEDKGRRVKRSEKGGWGELGGMEWLGWKKSGYVKGCVRSVGKN